jgi:hypothetical protein
VFLQAALAQPTALLLQLPLISLHLQTLSCKQLSSCARLHHNTCCSCFCRSCRCCCTCFYHNLLSIQVFLQAALAQPATPLLQLPLMDEAETQLVLRGFNATDVPYNDTALVHSSFAQHAAARPDAACVVFEETTYSYAQVRPAQTVRCRINTW